MNDVKQLELIMQDKEFVAAIIAMENPTDVQKAFLEKGISFTVDEINAIANVIFSDNSEEMSEEEMDSVAGGILTEIGIIAGAVSLFGGIMAEVNNSRKAKGKSTIW